MTGRNRRPGGKREDGFWDQPVLKLGSDCPMGCAALVSTRSSLWLRLRCLRSAGITPILASASWPVRSFARLWPDKELSLSSARSHGFNPTKPSLSSARSHGFNPTKPSLLSARPHGFDPTKAFVPVSSPARLWPDKAFALVRSFARL